MTKRIAHIQVILWLVTSFSAAGCVSDGAGDAPDTDTPRAQLADAGPLPVSARRCKERARTSVPKAALDEALRRSGILPSGPYRVTPLRPGAEVAFLVDAGPSLRALLAYDPARAAVFVKRTLNTSARHESIGTANGELVVPLQAAKLEDRASALTSSPHEPFPTQSGVFVSGTDQGSIVISRTDADGRYNAFVMGQLETGTLVGGILDERGVLRGRLDRVNASSCVKLVPTAGHVVVGAVGYESRGWSAVRLGMGDTPFSAPNLQLPMVRNCPLDLSASSAGVVGVWDADGKGALLIAEVSWEQPARFHILLNLPNAVASIRGLTVHRGIATVFHLADGKLTVSRLSDREIDPESSLVFPDAINGDGRRLDTIAPDPELYYTTATSHEFVNVSCEPEQFDPRAECEFWSEICPARSGFSD